MSAPVDALTAALAALSIVDDDDNFFPFAALPSALALQIFAALPADTRLRCAEVCRDWRALMAERSLWTRLDLSRKSGVTHRVTPALLRAAASKAGGALTALDVSGVWKALYDDGVLREVLAANAGTLRELRCLSTREHGWVCVPDLEALLSAAPQLRACEADVLFNASNAARPALRNEGVFGPLRAHAVCLRLYRLMQRRSCLCSPTWRPTALRCSLTARLSKFLRCWTRSWTLRCRSCDCARSVCLAAACRPPLRRLWRAC
jgi:hypothetical protein